MGGISYFGAAVVVSVRVVFSVVAAVVVLAEVVLGSVGFEETAFADVVATGAFVVVLSVVCSAAVGCSVFSAAGAVEAVFVLV